MTYERDPLQAETPLLETRLREQLTCLLQRWGSWGGGVEPGPGAALTASCPCPQRLRGGAAAQHAQHAQAAAGAAHGQQVLHPRPPAGPPARPQPPHGGHDPHRQVGAHHAGGSRVARGETPVPLPRWVGRGPNPADSALSLAGTLRSREGESRAPAVVGRAGAHPGVPASPGVPEASPPWPLSPPPPGFASSTS